LGHARYLKGSGFSQPDAFANAPERPRSHDPLPPAALPSRESGHELRKEFVQITVRTVGDSPHCGDYVPQEHDPRRHAQPQQQLTSHGAHGSSFNIGHHRRSRGPRLADRRSTRGTGRTRRGDDQNAFTGLRDGAARAPPIGVPRDEQRRRRASELVSKDRYRTTVATSALAISSVTCTTGPSKMVAVGIRLSHLGPEG
jgi:hypothetical protein